jgi:hypothetical protein
MRKTFGDINTHHAFTTPIATQASQHHNETLQPSKSSTLRTAMYLSNFAVTKNYRAPNSSRNSITMPFNHPLRAP